MAGRRYRGRRRRGGAPRRLKRYVNNAITKRLPAKQHFTELNHPGITHGLLHRHVVGQSIVKGTDRGDRVGDSIDMKGIKIRFNIKNERGFARAYPVMRIMLLKDREPHISLGTNMFKGEGTTSYNPENYVSTGDFDQIWKPLNRRKFAVLMDKKIKLLPYEVESMGKWQKNFTVYIPLKYRIKYNPDADGGDYDYIKPNLNFCYFFEVDNGAAVSAPTDLDFNAKVTWFYRG